MEAGRPFDLVLIDLQLGGTNGRDVCRQLRAAGVAIPIVCMSADAIGAELVRAAGFDGALEKPYSADELRACVERYARRGHAG